MQKSSPPDSLMKRIKILKYNLPKFLNLGVKKIGIYGSSVTGTAEEHSDLDILIEFKKSSNTYENLINIHSLLQELFPEKIDLVTIEGLSPYIKESVMTEVVFVEANV